MPVVPRVHSPVDGRSTVLKTYWRMATVRNLRAGVEESPHWMAPGSENSRSLVIASRTASAPPRLDFRFRKKIDFGTQMRGSQLPSHAAEEAGLVVNARRGKDKDVFDCWVD